MIGEAAYFNMIYTRCKESAKDKSEIATIETNKMRLKVISMFAQLIKVYPDNLYGVASLPWLYFEAITLYPDIIPEFGNEQLFTEKKTENMKKLLKCMNAVCV